MMLSTAIVSQVLLYFFLAYEVVFFKLDTVGLVLQDAVVVGGLALSFLQMGKILFLANIAKNINKELRFVFVFFPLQSTAQSMPRILSPASQRKPNPAA